MVPWSRVPGGRVWPKAAVAALLALLVVACGGSDDEGLDDLALADVTLDPPFDTDVFDYTADVANSIASTTVTPTVADSASTVTVNDIPVASGTASPPITLVVGENTILVVVTDEDGDSDTYTVVVTRLPSPSDNPALASLALTAGDLDQIFDGDITDYTASVGHYGAATRIVAEPEAPRAAVELGGEPIAPGQPSDYVPLTVGETVIEVDVTAEDGSASRTYQVEVTRAEPNTLQQQAYLKASNTGPDFFGASLSISRNTLVIGAPSEGSASPGVDGDETDNSLTDAGAAYVFDRSGSTWMQSAYLKASNPGDPDLFGAAVAIDLDLLVVGAEGEQSLATGIDGDQDDDSSTFVGAVYVFERDGMEIWEQIAYLKASNAGEGDSFGDALDLDGDRAIVGAWSEDSDAVGVDGDGSNDNLSDAGAAYLFSRDETGLWRQDAYLKASNTDSGDELGSAVAISGTTAVAGAPLEDSAATGVDGSDTDNSSSAAGAVYLFDADEQGDWALSAYVKASNTDPGDLFGAAVALDGDLLAVGAPGESGGDPGVDGDQQDDSVSGAGAVYVFERDESGNWLQVAYIKASSPGIDDAFGATLALSGNVLAVGAPGENSAATGLDGDELDDSALNAGAVYVFERDASGEWLQVSYVKASNTGSGDELGGAVGFDGDTLAVGAPFEDGGDTGVNGDDTDDSVEDAGAAYVIR